MPVVVKATQIGIEEESYKGIKLLFSFFLSFFLFFFFFWGGGNWQANRVWEARGNTDCPLTSTYNVRKLIHSKEGR